LELQCGIVAGLATPALAERVGPWSAEHEQQAVLDLLQAEHEVGWSVTSLRKVAKAVRDGVAEPGLKARQERIVELLQQANASKGRHRPTLACGRDGVMVPIRSDPTAKKKSATDPAKSLPIIEPKSARRGKGKKTKGDDRYQEASTGTASVHDRRGKRLGSVYYGQMPESGQKRLSQDMIAALTYALVTIHGLGQACPRLSYVTDAGKHQRNFFRQVLRKLADPWRPGQRLVWEWTVDFYHACTHLWKMADALFGDTKQAWAWYRRMRHWLRRRDGGVAHVLRSASQHENATRFRAGARKVYGTAYRYLRRYSAHMDYATRAKNKLPIGSGVTEAACKTVFAERLKRSGMTWTIEGGQTIVDLRVLVLSRVWDRSYLGYLRGRELPIAISYQPRQREIATKAA